MADVKITTPNRKLPSASSPKEGVDYTVSSDAPQDGDLILRDGKIFMQYFSPPAPPTGPVDPVEPAKTPLELVMERLDAIEAKVDALS